MPELVRGFWRHFRRRRRRFWRYVSPQRRGFGLVLLLLLVSFVGGYCYLTNGARIRRLAENYLTQLTGGDVHIGEADFRLFGNVELKDVVVRVPGDDSLEPLFTARKVILSHHPWETMFSGRVKATEIVCLSPVVSIWYYEESSDYNNVAKLAQLAHRTHSAGAGLQGTSLPPIRVRDCKVRTFRGRPRRFQGEMSLVMSLVPTPDGYYDAIIENESKAGRRLRSRWHYRVATGDPVRWEAKGDILHVAAALPPAYEKQLRRFFTAGNFHATCNRGGEEEQITVTLSDAALKLPPEIAVLRLEGVAGKVLLLPDRQLQIETLTGRLADPAAGQLTLSGRYGETQGQAGFDLTIEVEDMFVPPPEGQGQLALALRNMHETYRPVGRVDVKLRIKQKPGEKSDIEGAIKAAGLSACHKKFPYPIENVRGDIKFTADTIRFENLHASRGGAEFVISGWVTNNNGDQTYDVTIDSKNLPIDKTLKAAIQPGTLAVVNDLDPRGFANVKTRIRKELGGQERTTLTFLAGADLTVSHSFFPYRVNVVGGSVHVEGREVVIPGPGEQAGRFPPEEQMPIRARRGRAEFVVYGRATGAGTDSPNCDFTIEADKLPLDAALADALDPQARAALAALNATGVLREVTAHLKQVEGGEVEFGVSARLEGMKFKYDGFPYEVRDAECKLEIQPGRIVVKDLTGSHGPTSIRLSGEVFLGLPDGGADLQIDVRNLVFDDDLLSAFGPTVRKTWKQIAPAGSADVTVSKYRENTPGNRGEIDYEVTLKPRDMTLGYAGMPYKFRIGGARSSAAAGENEEGHCGVIIATPGKVELRGLRSHLPQKQEMLQWLDGVILYDDETINVKHLAMKAKNLPLDATHIKALQKAGFPLAARLSPGGGFDIDLKEINVAHKLASPEAPGGEGAATTLPAGGSTKLSVTGSIVLRDVAFGFGLGKNRASGRVSGTVASDEKGLALDGEIAGLDLVVAGKRPVQRLNGRFKKLAGKPLLIEEISGEAYGGRLEAQALVTLDKPMKYRLRVTFEGLRLAELLNGGDRKDELPEFLGIVDGTMEMRGTAGEVADRRASGVLRISKAKLFKLPIFLSVLQVVTLSLPRNGPYGQGSVIYEMKGATVVFREIRLGGAGASIVGSGKMDTESGELNLTFLSGPPGVLPGIGGLEELLQGILREIVEVRITGTLEKPEVKTVPLRSLKAIIDILTRPEQAGK